MGSLTELDVDASQPSRVGVGLRLVEWWNEADEDDRATLRGWVEAKVPYIEIAERLTRAGCPISQATVGYGVRLLRRLEWAP